MPTASKAIRTHADTGTRHRRRSRPLLYLGAATLCALAATIAAFTAFGGGSTHTAAATAISPQSMAVAVTVDGRGVPVRELELFLAQERANAFAFFQQQYGDGDHPGFWTTAYAGQTPQDYLKKLAVADAVRDTVQQNLAHRYGLVSDPGYAAFLRALDTENARRELALVEHQPVYGPVQYTEAEYFTYERSQLSTDLQAALIDHGIIPVTDSALRQYYAAHQSDYQQTSGAFGGATGPQAPPGAAPFDQVKNQVAQDYEQSSYNALITRLADAASVHLDTGVLASIEVS